MSKDDLTSSWGRSYEATWMDYLFIYGIVVIVAGLFYFIAYKRKKLPYASLILK